MLRPDVLRTTQIQESAGDLTSWRTALQHDVYHGTSSQSYTTFSTAPGFPPGYFFTTEIDVATRYAAEKRSRPAGQSGPPRVVVARLRIKNPYVLTGSEMNKQMASLYQHQEDIDELTSKGYDGIAEYKRGLSTRHGRVPGWEFMVFDPSDIKIVDVREVKFDDEGRFVYFTESAGRSLRQGTCTGARPDVLAELSMSQAESRFSSKDFIEAAEWFSGVCRKILPSVRPEGSDSVGSLARVIRLAVPRDIDESDKAQVIFWIVRNFIAAVRKAKSKDLPTSPDEFHSMVTTIARQYESPLTGPRIIETFFLHKRHFDKKDLMQYKTYDEFYNAYDAAQSKIRGERSTKVYRDATAGTEKIIDDPDWEVFIPHNRGAACELGKGTVWCTAAPGTLRDLYARYHKPHDPLVVFISKHRREERYQFHFGTDQFMDRDNRPVPEHIKQTLFAVLWNNRATSMDKIPSLERNLSYQRYVDSVSSV